MKDSIQHSFFFMHPAATVWKYLTTAELLEQWLMKNNFRPIVGYQFQFNFRGLPELGFDGNIYCAVLEIIPFKKLVYSWKAGPGNGVITLDSLVEWTLREKDNGTELKLNHKGFTEKSMTIYELMYDGWLRNMKKIDEYIKAENYDATKA